MTIVRMNPPVGTNRATYGNAASIIADSDGIIAVPMFAVPDLQAQGCEAIDTVPATIDVMQELTNADAMETKWYLATHGVSPQEILDMTDEEEKARAIAIEQAK
jgi:hypothetical protein